jgi:hypothetical protein
MIGMTEGGGSFIIDGRNNLQFVITQGLHDINILSLIKKELGFGRVIKQGKRTFRFIVEQKILLELIILIFNGNMVLPTRIKRFILFVEAFNRKAVKGKIILKNVKLKEFYIIPSLDNQWLTGLIDSEGCFHARFPDNTGVRYSFLLCQKGGDNLPILCKILLVLKGGVILEHHNKGSYLLILTGIKEIYSSNLLKYLDKNSLKSIKLFSYLL